MTTPFRKMFIGGAVLCLLVGASACIILWDELTEAFQAQTCRTPCPALTPAQLKAQVLKTYLHLQLDLNAERRDSSGAYQLALIARELTAQDLASAVNQGTLLGTLTSAEVRIESHAQIDALPLARLTAPATLLNYSLQQREAVVVPTGSVRPASLSEAEARFRDSRTVSPTNTHNDAPTFSAWERLRGYGDHFFWITAYPNLSLVCCDGAGDKQGLDLGWWNRNSLLNIQSARSSLMAVSPRGAILHRTYDGYDFIYF